MPPTDTQPQPPLLTDWPMYAHSLDWLERLRDLLDEAGVWNADFQTALGHLGGALLLAASGRTTPPVPGCQDEPQARPMDGDDATRRAPAAPPRPSAPRIEQIEPQAQSMARSRRTQWWSIAERLEALGYPALLTKSQRIKLGQQVVQVYREQHGTSPPMAANGHGPSAQRTARYREADLPLVDEVIRAHLGAPARRTDDADTHDTHTG